MAPLALFSQAIPVRMDTLPIPEQPLAEEQAPHPTVALPDTVTIIGVGDIMMGTDYPENRLPPDDGRFLMAAVAHILRDAPIPYALRAKPC